MPVDQNGAELDAVLPAGRDDNLLDVGDGSSVRNDDVPNLSLCELIPNVHVTRCRAISADELDGDLVVGAVVAPSSNDNLDVISNSRGPRCRLSWTKIIIITQYS